MLFFIILLLPEPVIHTKQAGLEVMLQTLVWEVLLSIFGQETRYSEWDFCGFHLSLEKCQNSTSVRRHPLPSKSFVIHVCFYHLMLKVPLNNPQSFLVDISIPFLPCFSYSSTLKMQAAGSSKALVPVSHARRPQFLFSWPWRPEVLTLQQRHLVNYIDVADLIS